MMYRVHFTRLVVVLALLGACASDEPDAQPQERDAPESSQADLLADEELSPGAPTSEPEATTAAPPPSSLGSGEEEASSSEAAPATAPNPLAVAPFTAAASCADPSSDVRFPNPAADLVNVDVVADGRAITITWEAAGPIAPSAEVEWRVEAFIPGGRYSHFFVASTVDGNWQAVAIEQGVSGEEGAGEAEVVDGSLRATFPFESMPDVEEPKLKLPFTWAALTSGAQIDGDYCPDRATPLSEEGERLPFG